MWFIFLFRFIFVSVITFILEIRRFLRRLFLSHNFLFPSIFIMAAIRENMSRSIGDLAKDDDQMVIYSPYKPTIEETIKPLLSTPDLSMEIESLLSDIHEVHRINLTTLGQEFQTLDIDIQNELMDLSNVNEVLQKAANIKEITIFDPTDIKLEKITESNTALKIVTWAVAILAFGFIIFCIVSCCPVQIFAMLKATFKAILALLTCTCTTAYSVGWEKLCL